MHAQAKIRMFVVTLFTFIRLYIAENIYSIIYYQSVSNESHKNVVVNMYSGVQ